DIYSLGLVLFELLTGRPAFQSDSLIGYVTLHLTQPTPYLREVNPQLPIALDEIIQTATAKEPDSRYTDVLAFARAFRYALQDKPKKGMQVINLEDEDSVDKLILVSDDMKGFVLTEDAIDLEAAQAELV